MLSSQIVACHVNILKDYRRAFRRGLKDAPDQDFLLEFTRNLIIGIQQRSSLFVAFLVQIFILLFFPVFLDVSVIDASVINCNGKFTWLFPICIILLPLWIWFLCLIHVSESSSDYTKLFLIFVQLFLVPIYSSWCMTWRKPYRSH